MKRPTKKEILSRWKNIPKDPNKLYRNGQKLFNIKGRLKDSDELVIEYVSELITEDCLILKTIGEDDSELRRKGSFNLSHDGISDDSSRLKRYGEVSRGDRPFAVALFNSEKVFAFGRILDYEVPLKEKKKSGIGEIDLVSISGNEVLVIELKAGGGPGHENNETLLRAVMEGFSFAVLLNVRKSKFVADYGIQASSILRPGVLTTKGSLCEKHMKMFMRGELPKTAKLLSWMNTYLNDLGMSGFRFYSFMTETPGMMHDETGRTVVSDPTYFDSEVTEYSVIDLQTL